VLYCNQFPACFSDDWAFASTLEIAGGCLYKIGLLFQQTTSSRMEERYSSELALEASYRERSRMGHNQETTHLAHHSGESAERICDKFPSIGTVASIAKQGPHSCQGASRRLAASINHATNSGLSTSLFDPPVSVFSIDQAARSLFIFTTYFLKMVR